MASSHGGFRERWTRQSITRHSDDADIPHVDVAGQDDDLEHVGFEHEAADFGQYHEPAFDDLSTHESEFVEQSQQQFVKPRPKSRPQSSSVGSTNLQDIKRTVDEFSSKQMHKQIADLKQPWQKGPLAALFGRQKPFWEKPAWESSFSSVGLADHISASDSVASIPQPIKHLESTTLRIRASRFISTDDDLRRLSLSRYKTMVLLDVEATRLGLSLLSFAGTLCTDDELGQIFSDVFSPKSSGTILKRCNAMWRFSCWLQTRGLGSPFHQTEGVIYSYVCHLRQSEAGSTTPSQFIEALRFSNGLLGFCKCSLNDILSSRVVGAAHSMYLTKRIRKPAEVLHTNEVRALEFICNRDEQLHHRVIAGHMLFCLMSAARWHDSMHVVSMELSRAGHLTLVEALTAKHKSSRAKELQRELLPFTALGQALGPDAWSEAWLTARKLSNCDEWPHFMCSWSEQRHGWTSSRMSTAEATGWLRELLEPTVGFERSAQLTVHGLKATILSWAAKSLMFTPDEQLALGHHVSAHFKSALIYSRDNQIGLCSKIYNMLASIKDGTLQPDSQRVQRLLQLTYNRAQEIHDEDGSSSSSSSSDASSVASSDGEHDAEEHTTFRRLDAAEINRDHCYINVRSRVIHLESVGHNKFWCGRAASSSFRKATREDLDRVESVICASCSHSFRASVPHGLP